MTFVFSRGEFQARNTCFRWTGGIRNVHGVLPLPRSPPLSPALSRPLKRPTGRHSSEKSFRRDFRLDASEAVRSVSASDDDPVYSDAASFLSAFWKFLRPHTIRGTLLGSVAVTSRALLENSSLVDWGLLPRALLGVLALVCGNGYIVGINQIFDVEIDEVNKPFLPIAAKTLSPLAAWFLVIGLMVAGVSITAMNFGLFITGLYSFGLFLGTIYSIPPFRLKQFAIPAFLIIAAVRGFLLNFGVFYATRAALGLKFEWSPAIIFITGFVMIFASAIAITKDLSDVKGDIRFKINTFATRLGVRNIAIIGTGLLLLNYLGAIGLALKYGAFFHSKFMIAAHSVLALKLLYEGGRLDASKYTPVAIRRYYGWVWNLFYAEYAIFPFL